MQALLIEFFGALVRWAIAAVAGYLVGHHILSPHDGDYFSMEFAKHAAMLAALGLALAWSLWQKYASRIKFLTALEAPVGTTEAQVQRRIAGGAAATLDGGPR